MQWKKGVLLAPYSTFRIGGKAKLFTTVTSIEELQDALDHITKYGLRYYLLGKGSNTLFDSRGFDGAVILNKIDGLEQKDNSFIVGSGYSFSLLGMKTAKMGYTGLEFSAGIPGSVGGAVYMNAGANGQSVSDTLHHIVCIDSKGIMQTMTKEALDFGYRFSHLQKDAAVVVSATFQLTLHSGARKKQLELLANRRASQPASSHSAGCMFRNPEKGFAGQYIDLLGLKGLKIGGAEISSVHGNFFVNSGEATSQNVLDLIAHVQEKVYSEYAVTLKQEVRYVPYR